MQGSGSQRKQRQASTHAGAPMGLCRCGLRLAFISLPLAPHTTGNDAGQQWDVMSVARSQQRPLGRTAEELYNAAHALEKSHTDDPGAAAHYRWALDLQPDMVAAHINLGNLLDSHGQLAEAAEHYRAARRAAPNFQMAALNLGNTYNRLSRTEEAAEALMTAVQIDPTNWQASLNMGNTLCALGRLPQAVELYTQLQQAQPTNPAYCFRLAYLMLQSGDIKAAAHMAREALRLEDSYVPALWVLGVASSSGGGYGSGLTERGIDNPSFARLASLLGEGDENALPHPVYASARDANLLKCPSWDEAVSEIRHAHVHSS